MTTQLQRFDNPRITAIIPIAVDTVLSVKDIIITFVRTTAGARALFSDQDVANSAARLALTGKFNGYTVYQVAATAGFYELIDETDPSNAASWQFVTTSQMRYVDTFINNCSWKVDLDSSIGNNTANTTYIMNGWMAHLTPTSAAMVAYGVPLAVNTERTFSGHAKHYFVYSATGTNLLFDIIFGAGPA